MKDMAQIREIKKHFTNTFRHQIEALGNNLSVGIGTNEAGEYTLRANLESDVGKDLLPPNFEGMSVVVNVIGTVHYQIPTTRQSIQTDISSANTMAGKFASEFKGIMERVGNSMGVGIKRDGEGKITIVAYLENKKGLDLLPKTFDGVDIEANVIGKVRPAEI